jgi:hypothetical protein
MKLGSYYKVIHYGWSDKEMKFPIYEMILGKYIQSSELGSPIYEFINLRGNIVKLHSREYVKIVEFNPSKQNMERAYALMNKLHNNISMKMEIIQYSCIGKRIHEI